MSRPALPLPSQEQLHALFEDAGWTVRRRSNGRLTARPSGNYLVTRVGTRMCLVHRILYKMRTGLEPAMVDHIDGNRLNNRPENLRGADDSTNQQNRGKPSNNTSGHKGVFYDRGAWRAVVAAQGKSHYGPRRQDKSAAIADAANLRQELHGAFAREV